MQSPLISIIIPVYNAEKILQQAIDSVQAQHWQAWEMIIVDGLSTDASTALVQKAQQTDHRIRLISEKDNGIYDAMNKGVAAANGEWLYFLGSDDQFATTNVLQEIVPLLEQSASDVIYGDVIMPGNIRYDGSFSFSKLMEKNISHQAIFYQKKVFEKVGVYNIAYKMHADWEFNIRCFSQGIFFEYTNQVIAFFGEGGVSAQHDVPFLQEVLLPLKIERLQAGQDSLKNIKQYDLWWRLLRNAQIRNTDLLKSKSASGRVPLSIERMCKFQQRFSPDLLRKGVVSKLLMLISYCLFLVRGKV
jgi:glycosyltransferase involved in cell wall biosynthesis